MTKSKEVFFCPRKAWKLQTEDEKTPFRVVEGFNEDGQKQG